MQNLEKSQEYLGYSSYYRSNQASNISTNGRASCNTRLSVVEQLTISGSAEHAEHAGA